MGGSGRGECARVGDAPRRRPALRPLAVEQQRDGLRRRLDDVLDARAQRHLVELIGDGGQGGDGLQVDYPSRSVHVARIPNFSDDGRHGLARAERADQALGRAGIEMKSSRNGDGGTAIASPLSDPDPDIRIPAPHAPLLLVLSGPSGVGKTTLTNRLEEQGWPGHIVVTVTTRRPRPGEDDGVHYHFRTPQQFREMKSATSSGARRSPVGNWYSVPAIPVREALAAGRTSSSRSIHRAPGRFAPRRKARSLSSSRRGG